MCCLFQVMNPCDYNPCYFGQCVSQLKQAVAEFTCDCEVGYTGPLCDRKV